MKGLENNKEKQCILAFDYGQTQENMNG